MFETPIRWCFFLFLYWLSTAQSGQCFWFLLCYIIILMWLFSLRTILSCALVVYTSSIPVCPLTSWFRFRFATEKCFIHMPNGPEDVQLILHLWLSVEPPKLPGHPCAILLVRSFDLAIRWLSISEHSRLTVYFLCRRVLHPISFCLVPMLLSCVCFPYWLCSICIFNSLSCTFAFSTWLFRARNLCSWSRETGRCGWCHLECAGTATGALRWQSAIGSGRPDWKISKLVWYLWNMWYQHETKSKFSWAVALTAPMRNSSFRWLWLTHGSYYDLESQTWSTQSSLGWRNRRFVLEFGFLLS